VFDAWKKFQKYFPKWWVLMVIYHRHGTYGTKKQVTRSKSIDLLRGFNPSEKYARQTWIISPSFGVKIPKKL